MPVLDRLALSALDWWEEAGVDTLVDEAPRDWLAAPRAVPAPAAAAAPPPAAVEALPADLAALRAWLRADPLLGGAAAARIDADGDPACGTMIVVDMPEAADRAAGRLLAGEAGALFERMLAPMGLARATIYLAPFSPARPASGRIDPAALPRLGRIMRHHVALAGPRRLLLLGDAVTRALLGLSCAEARGRVHQFAGAGAPVPSVASFHPGLLLRTPERKRASWADLQIFMGL